MKISVIWIGAILIAALIVGSVCPAWVEAQTVSEESGNSTFAAAAVTAPTGTPAPDQGGGEAQPAVTEPSSTPAQPPAAPAGGEATQPSVSAPAEAPAPAQKAPGDERKDILDKLQTLEKQVETLKEQAHTREKLTVTKEEKAEEEKAVLSAVGREYTLMKKGKFEVEYDLRYEYLSSNEIVSATRIEPRANHTIRNIVAVQYGLRDNLTPNISVPFVFVYDKTGTNTAKEASDLGDVSIGCDYQPFKSGGEWPTTTFSLSLTLPTGRSPYEMDRDVTLPTGNGFYGLSLGVNMSKSIDPAMAFGSFSYAYRLKPSGLSQNMNGAMLEGVEPGGVLSAAIGMAYAVSYAVSMNVQFQYGYNFSTKYSFSNTTPYSSSAYSNASIAVGTGWRVTPKTTVSVAVGIGLTKDDPDFTFTFRLPFDF